MDTGGESCIDHDAARRVYWFDCRREHADTRQNRDLMSSRFRCGLSKGISVKDLSKQLALGIATALLASATVSAQNSTAKPAATAKTQAVSTAREASSGMATGRQAAPAPAGTSSNAKNSGHATEKLEYKDPEDMTTRTRPGNNKTVGVNAPANGAAAPAADKAKQTGLPACDGASKDAAKCVAAPATGSQATTRVNKVESFTVKQ
jgi:hypothetical protein